MAFNNDYEYAVTGLNLNIKIPKNEPIRITTKEKVEKAMEIKQIVDDYVEPDLSLYIVNTETETIKIPFTKKNATDLPPLKFDYFDYSAQKTKQVSVYDFEGHLKKFGFEWKDTPSNFKYTIKKVNDKIEKKIFLSELTRKKIVVDEQRILNLYRRFNFGQPFNVRKDLISLLDGYLFYPKQFNTTQTVYDFTRLSYHERKTFCIIG